MHAEPFTTKEETMIDQMHLYGPSPIAAAETCDSVTQTCQALDKEEAELQRERDELAILWEHVKDDPEISTMVEVFLPRAEAFEARVRAWHLRRECVMKGWSNDLSRFFKIPFGQLDDDWLQAIGQACKDRIAELTGAAG